MKIRLMRPDDLDEVVEIERKSFRMPWSRDSFLKDISNPIVVSIVGEENGRIAGYLILWVFEDVLHIANIAVAPHLRRKGLGSQLIRRTIELARSKGVHRVELEVRRSNREAIRFYEKHGFRHVRTVKGYYQPEFEDALVYALDLTS